MLLRQVNFLVTPGIAQVVCPPIGEGLASRGYYGPVLLDTGLATHDELPRAVYTIIKAAVEAPPAGTATACFLPDPDGGYKAYSTLECTKPECAIVHWMSIKTAERILAQVSDYGGDASGACKGVPALIMCLFSEN